jgi:CheY-like chemotaxis protein
MIDVRRHGGADDAGMSSVAGNDAPLPRVASCGGWLPAVPPDPRRDARVPRPHAGSGGVGAHGSQIRVLVADDHHAFRRGLVRALSADPGVEVVAEAADGTRALTLARGTRPDVALLDVRMPGVDGFELCRRLAADPDTSAVRLILMTAAAVESFGREPCRVGALAILSKDLDRDDFVAAVAKAGRVA